MLDGDGITMHGFDGGPPDLNDPLKHAWTSNTAAWKGGDRLSASLINARHPDVFRCLNGCLDAAGEQMRDLPGLVLSPSDSVVRRISCMTWHDAGSLNYNCRPLTTPGCVGGCPREDQWHATRYERWARDELESMMLQQDEFMQWGACRTLRDDCDDASFAAVGGFYNEIIIDKWRDPWEPELEQMIEAVFVAPMASMSSMAYARAVHDAVVERLGFQYRCSFTMLLVQMGIPSRLLSLDRSRESRRAPTCILYLPPFDEASHRTRAVRAYFRSYSVVISQCI